MAKTFKGIQVEIGASTTGLGKALKDIDAQGKDLQKSLKSVNDLLKLDPSNTEYLAKKQELLAQQVTNTSKRLQTLQSVQKQVNEQFKNGKIDLNQYTSFNKELIQTKNKLEQVKTEQNNLKKSSVDLGQAFNKLSDSAIDTGDVMKANLTSTAIIAGLKAIADGVKTISAACVNVGKEFDSSMAQVAATMGITSAEIEKGSESYYKLREAAKETGATTSFTASQSAEALNYLALAGYDVNKSIATLPKVLTLAKSSGMDLATASDMVTDAMSALKLNTSDVDTYIDQMAKTAQKSNTSVQQLGEATLNCAGTITSAGQSLTSMNTALGVLADNGIKGSEAGDKLRNILLTISAPTQDATKQLDNLGVSLTDNAGNIRDITDVMTDLNSALADMGSGERTQTLSTIFNKTDINAVNALLNATTGRFTELSKEIENSNGAAKSMADTMSDNLQGDITQLQSALEGIGISIYEKFETPLRNGIKAGIQDFTELNDSVENGKLADSFDELGNTIGNIISGLSDASKTAIPALITGLSNILKNANLIVGALSGITTAKISRNLIQGVTQTITSFRTLATAIKTAKTAQTAFNAVTSASPIGAIATLIGAAVGAFISYKTQLKETKQKTNELVTESQQLTETIKQEQEQREKNRTDIDAEYDSYSKLADKVYELAGQEKLTNAQKQNMLFLIDKLNDKVQNLNLKYDETTNTLSLQRQEVQRLIDKTKEYYQVQAAQDSLVEIGKQQYETEKKINDLQTERANAYKGYQNTLAIEAQNQKSILNNTPYGKTATLTGKTPYYSQSDLENLAQGTQAVKDAKKAYQDIDAEIQKQKTNLKNLDKEYKYATNFVEEHSDAMDGNTDSTGENTSAIEENAQAESDRQKAINSSRNELVELTKVLQQVNEGQALSTDQVFNLVEKYPELATAIKSTKDGYILEADAIKKLTEARVKDIQALQAEKIQKLENQKASIESKYNAKLTESNLKYGTGYSTDSYKNLLNSQLRKNANAEIIRQRNQATKEINKQIQQAKAQNKAYNSLLNDLQTNGYKSGTTKTSTTNTSSTAKSTAKASLKDTEDTYKAHVEKLLANNDYLHSIGKKSDEQYYKYIRTVRDKYYKGNKKYIDEYRQLTKQLYDYQQELAEQEQSKREERIQKKFDDLEYQYNIGKISAEDYYKKLNALNEKYYKNKKEYLEKYREINEKVQNGLQQTEEDRFNTLVDVQSKINDIAKAETNLTNAKNKRVRLYSEQAGWQTAENTSTVNSAKDTLKNAQLSYIQTAVKAGIISNKQLQTLTNNLASKLPQLDKNYLSNIGKNQTTNQTNNYNMPSTVKIDKIVTNNPEAFVKQVTSIFQKEFTKVIKQTNNNRKVGK